MNIKSNGKSRSGTIAAKAIHAAILLGAAFIFAPLDSRSQGEVYLSNLAEPPSFGQSFSESMWVAQVFVTGTAPGGYNLDSVQLSLDVIGNPDGNVVVYLYGSFEGGPGAEEAEINSATPSDSGTYTFTNEGIFLSPSTTYFIAVTTTANSDVSPYEWIASSDFNYTSNDNWSLPESTSWTSADGSNWVSYTALILPPYQFAVTATPAPQPVLSPSRFSNGHFTIAVTGSSNQTYTVQMATNLPSPNWVSLLVTNPPSGSFLFTDPNATNHDRFYRVEIAQ